MIRAWYADAMVSWFGRALFLAMLGCGTSRSSPAQPNPSPTPTSVQVPASAATAEPSTPDFTKLWQLLDGWKPEVIPFPLGFAPSIDLIGAEVLRFAPDFYNRAAPGYFTYAFVWHAAVPSYPITAAWLRSQLAAYFDGLCVAVSDPPGAGCAAHPTQVTLAAPTTPPFSALAGVPAHSMTLQIFDAFKANLPVALAGTVTVARCGTQLLVAVTLAPPGSLAAAALLQQAQTFALPASTPSCVDALR